LTKQTNPKAEAILSTCTFLSYSIEHLHLPLQQ
ncbi:hypothetical protein FOXB_06429, partial [Fusarium oxysporum f. sp. conglutinans Fo5176]